MAVKFREEFLNQLEYINDTDMFQHSSGMGLRIVPKGPTGSESSSGSACVLHWRGRWALSDTVTYMTPASGQNKCRYGAAKGLRGPNKTPSQWVRGQQWEVTRA